MALAVGMLGELFSAAEMELRCPRITERPTAIVAFEIDELLRPVASVLNDHDRRTREVHWCHMM